MSMEENGKIIADIRYAWQFARRRAAMRSAEEKRKFEALETRCQLLMDDFIQEVGVINSPEREAQFKLFLIRALRRDAAKDERESDSGEWSQEFLRGIGEL